jgi:hypothetical protein
MKQYYKTCLLEVHFHSREQSSHSEWHLQSTVVGWWQECFSRRGISAQEAMCGSVRHHDVETTVAVTCRTASPNCIVAQPLQNLHAEMTSNTLSTRYELKVQQTVDVKEFRELFDNYITTTTTYCDLACYVYFSLLSIYPPGLSQQWSQMEGMFSGISLTLNKQLGATFLG